MSDEDDLERCYQKHQTLRRKLPNAWNAFFARFGSLRPVQRLAVPPILQGQNVLITAPTAGGKTEAVAAPVCERILSNRWVGLSVLLVTPTRALVNDLFYRLEKPCEHLGVVIGRKTSDHSLSEDLKEQLLVTTPESLESLLTFRRHALDNLKVVIIDEIHLLDGSARGDQLRLLLRRLSKYLHHAGGSGFTGLQTVAMSATVPDPRRLADIYLGERREICHLPPGYFGLMVISCMGKVAERSSRALYGFMSFFDTRTLVA